MNLDTIGWLPIGVLSVDEVSADIALLAVLSEVYVIPCSWSRTKKSSTVVTGRLWGEACCSPQNSNRRLRYGWYCICVPTDQECKVVSVALPEMLLWRKPYQRLCKPKDKVAFTRGVEQRCEVVLVDSWIEEEGEVCPSEGVTASVVNHGWVCQRRVSITPVASIFCRHEAITMQGGKQ